MFEKDAMRVSAMAPARAQAPVKHRNMNHSESVLFILVITLNMLISLLSFWRVVIRARYYYQMSCRFCLGKREKRICGLNYDDDGSRMKGADSCAQ